MTAYLNGKFSVGGYRSPVYDKGYEACFGKTCTCGHTRGCHEDGHCCRCSCESYHPPEDPDDAVPSENT